ncbi:DNA-binding transcriptional LysR family regulator [Halospina denitrificans]|uniref:DNA-binding transcriptional LysR family regulator n=1 Tax=Halospina denitrificans TaxID=332522 RepID=A0A4R7JVM8_9GAMM|nr:LysR family transcriptional regulator [Halospina denitrificans]TDT41547.1 DNA-binding transcriptional LysR family regulator [Halospina denitrificans]
MDTQALTAFVAVVDAGSFSIAAENLHLTQSAVSKRVATLEDQAGRELIERHGRRISLTDAGRALLPHARQVLDDLHNARQSLTNLDTELQGPLRLITSHHIGLHHLPRWLRALTQRHPDLRFQLQFMESEQALEQLDQRDAPLAWVTLNDRVMEKFQVWFAWEDPMSFVCGTDHPLAARESITLRDLAEYQAILPAASTETYRVISHLFLEQGLRLEAQMPTNYLETIKMMTSVGLGWSVLPDTMLDDSLRVLSVDQPVTRMLGAVGLRGREPGRAARELVDVVREQEAPAG